MRWPVGLAFTENYERQAAMPSQESYRDVVLRVIDEVVAPGAGAPTTPALEDFIGRALLGLPLLGEVS